VLAQNDMEASDMKRAKIAAFKFIRACLSDLSIPAPECFVIADLIGTDTTGFVKVRPRPSSLYLVQVPHTQHTHTNPLTC